MQAAFALLALPWVDETKLGKTLQAEITANIKGGALVGAWLMSDDAGIGRGVAELLAYMRTKDRDDWSKYDLNMTAHVFTCINMLTHTMSHWDKAAPQLFSDGGATKALLRRWIHRMHHLLVNAASCDYCVSTAAHLVLFGDLAGVHSYFGKCAVTLATATAENRSTADTIGMTTFHSLLLTLNLWLQAGLYTETSVLYTSPAAEGGIALSHEVLADECRSIAGSSGVLRDSADLIVLSCQLNCLIAQQGPNTADSDVEIEERMRELLNESGSFAQLTEPAYSMKIGLAPPILVAMRANMRINEFEAALQMAQWVADNGVYAQARSEAYRILAAIHAMQGKRVEAEAGLHRAIECARQCSSELLEAQAAADIHDLLGTPASQQQLAEATGRLEGTQQQLEQAVGGRVRPRHAE